MSVVSHSLFKSPTQADLINRIHDGIKKRSFWLSPRQCFAVGNSWGADKTQHLRVTGVIDRAIALMKTWDYGNLEVEAEIKALGIYNRIELRNLWHHAALLRRIDQVYDNPRKHKNYLDFSFDEDDAGWPTEQSRTETLNFLRDVSLMTDYSTCLMAIKEFLCATGTEDLYTGLVPATGPAMTGTFRIFGRAISNNYEHTVFCAQVAGELDISPMRVNTGFWLAGQGS